MGILEKLVDQGRMILDILRIHGDQIKELQDRIRELENG